MNVNFKRHSVDLSLSNRDINIGVELNRNVDLHLNCKEIDVSMKLTKDIGANLSIESIAAPEQIKELTGPLPLSFRTISDNPLIDWRITGAAGGVGKIGINYLKQVERSMPDGTYGLRVYTTPSWITTRTGTVNSGQATAIGFNFHKSDNSNILPSDVGKMYIMAGEGDPKTEGVELDVFQGGVKPNGDYNRDYWITRYGDDGSGTTVLYADADTGYIPIRCGTAVFALQPNTSYSFKRVGGASDVEIQYTTAKGRADLNISWSNISGLNSIPGDTLPQKSIEQWTTVSGYNRYWYTSTSSVILDSRPATFEHCAYYADLKAGSSYKVIAEYYGDNQWQSTRILDDQTPYMALVSEDNVQILSKTSIFRGSTKFQHEEYGFSLGVDTRVGLYFKAIPKYNTIGFVRFMIVDSSVNAEPFTVRDGSDTISGETCWEPYHVTLPLTIQNGEQSATVTIDLGTDLLGADDVIDFAASQTTIPTFAGGVNTITVDSDIQPSEMYIKYKKY